MPGGYDPGKRFIKVCRNPLKLIISYEDGNGLYILTDENKVYGRVLDLKSLTLFDAKYLLAILKYNPIWHKYTGGQEILQELLSNIKYIWDTPPKPNGPNRPRDFKIDEFTNG